MIYSLRYMLDIKADNIMFGIKDDSVFTDFEDSAGVYCVGEVDYGDPAVVCPYQNVMSGVLNYPM